MVDVPGEVCGVTPVNDDALTQPEAIDWIITAAIPVRELPNTEALTVIRPHPALHMCMLGGEDAEPLASAR